MSLSIADRRAVMAQCFLDESFRERLLAHPRDAVRDVTGKTLPPDARIQVMDEGDRDWCFVMIDPAQIDAELPEVQGRRDAVENDVYALLRDQPALAAEAEKDPMAFLTRHFGIEVTGIDMRREAPGETLLIAPNLASDELSDDMLDLVSAGGDPGCQSGAVYVQYTSPTGGG